MTYIIFLHQLIGGWRRKNMCEQRKIDFYPTKELFQSVRNDTELFEIFKKDKEQNIMVKNINEFLNRFLHGYFSDYIKELEGYSSHISKILREFHIEEDTIRDIINSMLDKVVFENNSKSTKKDNKSSIERRFFKTTNKYNTLDIIEIIDSKYLIQNPNLSEYICKMLRSYFTKPLYRREQIIFSDEYSAISESCQKNCIRFRYTYDNKTYTVMPYKIFTGKEQMFNYVFCYGLDEESKLRNYSFRLSRMSGIQKSYSSIPYPSDIEDKFILTSKLGASYAINDELEETCVILSPAGTLSFKHIYFGRPKVDRKEITPSGNYKYYFTCSTEQLYRYFRRFNPGEAIIEYPTTLRDKIIDFHTKSLEGYENLENNKH